MSKKPVARLIPAGRQAVREIQEAAKELHALRYEMASRRGFKPLTIREIREAVREGRR